MTLKPSEHRQRHRHAVPGEAQQERRTVQGRQRQKPQQPATLQPGVVFAHSTGPSGVDGSTFSTKTPFLSLPP
jgi:hypothetical protein